MEQPRRVLLSIALVAPVALAVAFAGGAIDDAAAQSGQVCAWTQIGQSTQPHYFMAGAYDGVNDHLYHYGGLNASLQTQDDFGAIDLTAPTLGPGTPHGLRNVSSLKRFGAAGAFRPAGAGSAAYFFGGASRADTGQGTSDIQRYVVSTDTWTQESDTGFDDRFFAAAAYAPDHDAILIVGGIRKCGSDDLPCTASNVDVKAMTWDASGAPTIGSGPMGGSAPKALFGHTMVYDDVAKRMLVFGGVRTTSRTEKTVYALDLSGPDLSSATWSQLPTSGGPQGLAGQGAAFDSGRNWMVVYGGVVSNYFIPDSENVSNRTWALDLSQTPATWIDLDATFGERVGGVMAFDARHSVALYHGGRRRTSGGASQSVERGTYMLTCAAAPTPTNTVPPPATNTPRATSDQPTPEPTAPPQPDLCDFARTRVSGTVLSWAMSNRDKVKGYGLLCNPKLPPSPYNIERTHLSLENPNKPFHPLYNSVIWKCGCP